MFVLGASLAASSPALADSADAGKAFDEGRKLRDQRDFERAAGGVRAQRRGGASIGAYYNLAFSYNELGRTREALDAYRTAQKMAKDKGDPREKEATEAVTTLLETHNYVTLNVPDDVDKTAGVRIVVDGEAIPQTHLKGEVFRSATQHEVVVSAPGRKERRVKLANKQTLTVTLGDAYETATSPLSPPPPPPPEASSGGWGWQKWTGAGMVAGGVVSLTITGILFFPYLAERLSLNSEISDRCGDETVPRGRREQGPRAPQQRQHHGCGRQAAGNDHHRGARRPPRRRRRLPLRDRPRARVRGRPTAPQHPSHPRRPPPRPPRHHPLGRRHVLSHLPAEAHAS